MKSDALVKFLAFLLGVVGAFTMNVYLPSLPDMSRYFQVSHDTIQLSVTFYLLGFGLAQLLYGPLSDYYGRRPVAIIGLGIGLVASIGCYYSHNINSLLFFRLLQGVGLASSITLMRSIMRDIVSGQALAKAMSYISLAFVIVPTVAPLLGGYIQEHNSWHDVFLFIIIMISLIYILILLFLRETNPRRSLEKFRLNDIIPTYKLLLNNRIFIVNLLCASLALAAVMAYNTAAPILFQHNFGLSPSQFGWASLLLALVMIPSRIVNAVLVQRVAFQKVILLSILIMLIGSVSLLLSAYFTLNNMYSFMIFMAIYIFGSAMIFPNTLTGALSPFGRIAGAAAALYGCVQMMFGFVGSGIVAVLPDSTPFSFAIIISAISAAALIVYWVGFSSHIMSPSEHIQSN